MSEAAAAIPVAYHSTPIVLVFADSDEGLAAASAAASAAGGRVGAALGLEGAADRLDEQPAVDAVLVEVGGVAGAGFDRLLDRLQAGAQAGRHRSVVGIVPELIDAAVARAPHADVMLLCGHDAWDRAAATSLALAPRQRDRVRERDDPPRQLRRLSEEVGRIARTLAALSTREAARLEEARPVIIPPAGFPENAPAAALLRAAIRARRMRDQYFDSGLFADPAWDMLLDLTAARLEKRSVAVSSLCIAAAVPPTTALRWIKMLTDEGLFVRVADPHDGRRVFIELSDGAAAAMMAYVAGLERAGLRLA